eukprot:PhM_4_TR13634/c0_g1_i2/m.13204
MIVFLPRVFFEKRKMCFSSLLLMNVCFFFFFYFCHPFLFFCVRRVKIYFYTLFPHRNPPTILLFLCLLFFHFKIDSFPYTCNEITLKTGFNFKGKTCLEIIKILKNSTSSFVLELTFFFLCGDLLFFFTVCWLFHTDSFRAGLFLAQPARRRRVVKQQHAVGDNRVVLAVAASNNKTGRVRRVVPDEVAVDNATDILRFSPVQTPCCGRLIRDAVLAGSRKQRAVAGTGVAVLVVIVIVPCVVRGNAIGAAGVALGLLLLACGLGTGLLDGGTGALHLLLCALAQDLELSLVARLPLGLLLRLQFPRRGVAGLELALRTDLKLGHLLRRLDGADKLRAGVHATREAVAARVKQQLVGPGVLTDARQCHLGEVEGMNMAQTRLLRLVVDVDAQIKTVQHTGNVRLGKCVVETEVEGCATQRTLQHDHGLREGVELQVRHGQVEGVHHEAAHVLWCLHGHCVEHGAERLCGGAVLAGTHVHDAKVQDCRRVQLRVRVRRLHRLQDVLRVAEHVEGGQGACGVVLCGDVRGVLVQGPRVAQESVLTVPDGLGLVRRADSRRLAVVEVALLREHDAPLRRRQLRHRVVKELHTLGGIQRGAHEKRVDVSGVDLAEEREQLHMAVATTESGGAHGPALDALLRQGVRCCNVLIQRVGSGQVPLFQIHKRQVDKDRVRAIRHLNGRGVRVAEHARRELCEHTAGLHGVAAGQVVRGLVCGARDGNAVAGLPELLLDGFGLRQRVQAFRAGAPFGVGAHDPDLRVCQPRPARGLLEHLEALGRVDFRHNGREELHGIERVQTLEQRHERLLRLRVQLVVNRRLAKQRGFHTVEARARLVVRAGTLQVVEGVVDTAQRVVHERHTCGVTCDILKEALELFGDVVRGLAHNRLAHEPQQHLRPEPASCLPQLLQDRAVRVLLFNCRVLGHVRDEQSEQPHRQGLHVVRQQRRVRQSNVNEGDRALEIVEAIEDHGEADVHVHRGVVEVLQHVDVALPGTVQLLRLDGQDGIVQQHRQKVRLHLARSQELPRGLVQELFFPVHETAQVGNLSRR